MGSKKKASKSKATVHSHECMDACDVELKVAEPDIEVPPSSELGVAAEESSETSPADPSVSKGEEISRTCDAKTPAQEIQVQETPEQATAVQEKTPGYLPPSGIPLSLKPEMSTEWPFTRKRQVFNVFYFGLLSFQLLMLTRTGAAPWAAYFCLALVSFLTAASVYYLVNHRKHQTSHDEFSPRVRRSLRAVGLLVPAFLMFAIVKSEPPIQDAKNIFEEKGITLPAYAAVSGDFAREMAQGKREFKRHRFENALKHFEQAARLEPSSDVAFSWMAESNDSMMQLTPALSAAMRAIDLNPNNEQAHVVAAHYYTITQNYEKAREFAQKAIAINPEDGEAYGYLSKAYNGLGDPLKALENDNFHVKYHFYESRAFEQRARTLELLGRHSEAEYTRELAKKVGEVGVR